VKVAKAEKIY